MKARFLEVYAAAPVPVRGAGTMTIRRDGSRRGAFQARWAAAGESVVVAGYVGPVRAVDAVLLGDSLFVALRPYDTGLTGSIRPGSLLDARAARFLARPWQLGDPWILGALERASIEPHEEGYRLRGSVRGVEGAVSVTLDLDERAAPRILRLSRGDAGEDLRIRYGPPRGFAIGRRPAWIEWSFRTTVARLEIEELASVDRTRIRFPGFDPDWTILALDDPRSEALFRRLLGSRGARR